ncbi:ATP-binding protein [Nocardiopsis alborubida]|uniref:histidine kinase n=1 Tax=Nocardiopsis alborubida TaxID=146802 RepID=A0A7X6MI57_9ACTN|nr:ATP-binding protein [Nocardiopsis alborubida]NKZ02032.1 ATP-binding protein [Nocardiopsis alborubida]
MHHPVHPHSQNSGRTSGREGVQPTAGSAPESGATERGDAAPPATGPFSGSAENGYRPSSRTSVPNPYTTRRVNVDDVDTGATPVNQWRGVGLDEPEPRTPPITATTDTMTDTSSSTERSERPQAPAAQTQAAPADTTPQPAPRPEQAGQQWAEAPHGQTRNPEEQGRSSRPEQPDSRRQEPPRAVDSHSQPEQPQASAPQAPDNHSQSEPPQAAAPPAAEGHQQAPQGWAGPAPQPYQVPGERPAPPQVQGQHGYAQQPNPGPAGHDPYAAPAPYQAAPGPQYGTPYHPAGQEPHHAYPPHPQAAPAHYPAAPQPHGGYAPPQHGGYAPQPQGQHPYPPQPAHYPAQYPPQPLVTYQSAYPAPFQPPGYVMHGQPMFYPGQYNPYGQPVQHIIVLAAGQQPQVISAESASTLLAEHTETRTEPTEREDRALTRAGSDTDAGKEQPEREQEREAPAEPAEPAEAAAPEAPAETLTERRAALMDAIAPAGPASSAPSDGRGSLLNEALAGLAMRDLSLVDALLEMVEELETDAQDPDLLDKLFQIDNFATRMRRNGENFLVLTGHDGGESDAHDEIVPLLDVARAATSEIKDYPRVRMGKIPQTSITGMAADDISHLLAELLDNATANSPEHSQVVISAQELTDGRLMIVVEDEGVGIPEGQLAELNGRLAGEPVLDSDVPRHMGLYVASRIAKKHGLEARLEPRSFRGVSAYAIIPKELLRVATPRTPGQARTSTVPSSAPPAKPVMPAPASTRPPASGSGKPPAANGSAVTSAGLPRRSATPHGSPLRMMSRPGQKPDTPQTREDTPPRLTGEARAEQIRDELGDFFDGEREAREGGDEPGNDQK